MAAITRKEARAQVFHLLFETEFHPAASAEEIYTLSQQDREFVEDAYIRRAYFGVREHLEEIDEIMTRHSNGWKVARLTRVSRAVIRLCVYEMANAKDVPATVAINEAIELSKKYDDDKARSFVNGVLNGIKAEYDAK